MKTFPRRLLAFKSMAKLGRRVTLPIALYMGTVAFPRPNAAQTWTWTTETVDKSGKFISLAVDHNGNLHLSYADGHGSIKYAFRPVNSEKWFNMVVDAGDAYTSIVVDAKGNPHLCHTFRTLKYARFDGKEWRVEPIAPGTGEVSFSCAVALTPQGTPIVSWYKTRNADNSAYDHLKCAIWQNGVWLVRTVDFDMQTGKWHSLFVDSKGIPHLSYDSFVKGLLKFASWDGTDWLVQTVDVRPRSGTIENVGLGNSLRSDPAGQMAISYQDNRSLKFATWRGDRWLIETVETPVSGLGSWVGWRTSLAFDRRGLPHVSFEDAGTLKHAYRDGSGWHVQILVPPGPDAYRYSSLAIGADDTLYIGYRDPADGSLKVAIGRPTDRTQTAESKKEESTKPE
jgi:hypothetical protein